jgi:hypothetical protein
MSHTAQDIFDEVRRTIHDEDATNYRWSDAELIDYLNAGCRQTVQLIPEANTVETIEDTGTSRIARQVLPAGGIKFIRVGRNYADDGTTPQGTVRYVEKDALDTYDPDWEYVLAAGVVDGANYFQHFCHDKREPTVYYLYPPPAADNKRYAAVYSADPTAVTATTDNFPLADEYVNGVVQYVVFRCFTKQSRQTLPSAFRQELWQNYLLALGLQRDAKDNVGPDENRPPDAG